MNKDNLKLIKTRNFVVDFHSESEPVPLMLKTVSSTFDVCEVVSS